jgi:Fe-S cluster biosynthesis and repair protein YggX
MHEVLLKDDSTGGRPPDSRRWLRPVPSDCVSESWCTISVSNAIPWSVNELRVLLVIIALIVLLAAGVTIIVLNRQPAREQLEYLHHEDTELGPAILDMIHHSAWAKWFRAQSLVNQGYPVNEGNLLQTACLTVLQEITDGRLEVRGRLPGQMNYNPIPRTYWRSSALTFITEPAARWKLILIPRGGAQIEPSGNVIASNQMAALRTAQITDYDSLIADARQFEKLWPKRNRPTDRKRCKLLWQAWWRDLDKDEIQQIS